MKGLGATVDGRPVLPSGVLHVGGHHGEEAEAYEAAGVRRVVWFEAEPDAFATLQANVGARPGHTCIHALVGERDGEERSFYRHRFPGGAKRGFCSTLPWNQTVVAGDPVLSRLETFDVASMTTVSAATALRARGFAPEEFQYLSVNVQGAELMVLRGLREYLLPIRWIFWEAEMDGGRSRYQGAPLVAEVAAWLVAQGFRPAGDGGRQQFFSRAGD